MTTNPNGPTTGKLDAWVESLNAVPAAAEPLIEAARVLARCIDSGDETGLTLREFRMMCGEIRGVLESSPQSTGTDFVEQLRARRQARLSATGRRAAHAADGWAVDAVTAAPAVSESSPSDS